MKTWSKVREVEPDYFVADKGNDENNEEHYEECLKRAVDDRIAELEADIHFYRKEANGTKGYIYDTEFEMADRELMFTTQNILMNDPAVREAVEKIILSEDGTLDKYLRGEM